MIEDMLDRDSVPLSSEQWSALNQIVVDTAKRSLVGRRFIPIYGPVGFGSQTVTLHEFSGGSLGKVDFTGDLEGDMIKATAMRHLPLPIIHQDFTLLWRDVAAAKSGMPLDLAPAAYAAAYTAKKEDDLIFKGDTQLGLEGILTVENRQVVPLSNWDTVGSAFADVTRALETLAKKGFYGSYALVVSPARYAQMHRVHEKTGVLEIRNVEELTTGGIFRSAVMPDDKVAIISSGAQNLDLAIAQDFVVGALGMEKMNVVLRVFEILALRIKRPGAIVTMEAV